MDDFNVSIKQAGEKFAVDQRGYNQNQIDHSEYDKTYVGTVVDKMAKATNTGEGIIDKWKVIANGTTYTVKAENTNIRSVGQKVRLYIPSNNRAKVYAETIDAVNVPDGLTYMTNVLDETSEWYDEKLAPQFKDYLDYAMNTNTADKDNVELDVIIERWLLADATVMERKYYVTLEDGHCTNLVCPDGKVINLIGW